MVKSQMCAVTKISYQLLSSSLPRAINLDMYIKSQDMEKSSAKWVIINLAVFTYSYFEKGCRKKCTRQSRKVLWVVLSSPLFKEIWKIGERGHGRMFASAKGKQQK